MRPSARPAGDAQVAFAGRVADVEGDEQVLGGIERVIHRSVSFAAMVTGVFGGMVTPDATSVKSAAGQRDRW